MAGRREGSESTVVVFDLDGTLLDSDSALVAPFLALGIRREDVAFGQPLPHECARLGVSVDDYLALYDTQAAKPYAGVEAVVERLDRWAVCSNKEAASGRAELARLGWKPEAALFADDLGGRKRLGPVLEALVVDASDVVFVGDTSHDRACAVEVGCRFALAGWNPRATPDDDEVVLARPADLLRLLGLRDR